GTMVARTAALRNIQRTPFIEINSEDAKTLGISEGDDVIVEGAGTEVTLPAKVNGIAKGHVFVPYDQRDFRANVLMSGADPRVRIRLPCAESSTSSADPSWSSRWRRCLSFSLPSC
ncbi:MAG: molybdopterin dinucleotide binding domain-containing protein, partial [Actinomycetota bacterium]